MTLQKRANKMSLNIDSHYKKLYEAAITSNVQHLEHLLGELRKAMSHQDLEDTISRVCIELKFNNIRVSDDTLLSLENNLLQMRFFCNDSRITVKFIDIENRAKLIHECVADLHVNVNNDEIFLATLTFLAKQIHVLKSLLKATYDRLPWEEIEFCILCFIRCSLTHHELNMFYKAIIKKRNLLKYLNIFSAKLVDLNVEIFNIPVVELSKIPKLKRDEIIERILEKLPEFQGLYNDYEHIRDIHSLSIISEYVELVQNADTNKTNGQNVIIRALQMIGEHVKNTLQSPKLSTTTSDLLLISLQKNTRRIIMNLRDSLSHAYSLSERLELHEEEDAAFFTGIKKDIKKIGRITEHILLKNKIQLIRTLGNQFIECEDEEQMKEIALNFKTFKILDILNNFRSRSDTSEIGQLRGLVEQLTKMIVSESHVMKNIVQGMQKLLRSEQSLKNETEDIKMGIAGGSIALLRSAIEHILGNTTSNKLHWVQLMKNLMKRALNTVTPNVEIQNLERITEMAIFIRMKTTNLENKEEISRVVNEIIHTVKFGIDRITWAEKFQQKLKQKHPASELLENNEQFKTKKTKSYRDQLTLKFAELANIFEPTSEKKRLTYQQFSKNRELQTVVEVLLLDIFSISVLLQKSQLQNKIFFFDDGFPSLLGKNMRNHLAHNNFLIDVLFNPTLTLFLNAAKVNEEGLNCLEQNIGKIKKYEYSDLKKQYEDIIEIISRKQRMFSALREGDVQTFHKLVNEGAEIRCQDLLMSTCLHFSAENPSVELVEYFYNQGFNLNGKNMELQTPLHVAATKGNSEIIEFILKASADCTNEIDYFKNTALHYAARNGHELAVRTLVKHKANIQAKNLIKFTPLHYGVLSGNIQVVRILMADYIGKNLPEVEGGLTVLHLASENSSPDTVKLLLTNHVNINAKTDTGATPLHHAANNGLLEVVEVLVQNGADVNAVCVNGDSPLLFAAKRNDPRIVEILLKHGANVNVTDFEGHYTPLHVAMLDKDPSVAKTLLHHGADVNAVTIVGFTALHFAVEARHVEVVRLFLQQKDVDVNVKCFTGRISPLQKASEIGEAEIAKLLIERGARLYDKTDHTTAIYLAAKNGHESIVKLLITNGASVNVKNSNGSFPLHAASASGNLNIIRSIIQSGAQVNAETSNGNNCLHIAARNGRDVVEYLVRNGVDINSKSRLGYTPLHEATLNNHEHVVKSLIINGADVDALDPKGYTAFHIAAAEGNKNIILTLLENNADINIENEASESPLFLAVLGNQKEIIDILISHSANYSYFECVHAAILKGFSSIVEVLLNHRPCGILEKSNRDHSFIHTAVELCQVEIVELLLNKGADVNASDSFKATPLFLAARKGFHEIAELLMAHGADVNLADLEGLTPLHAASKYGNFKIAEMLIERGARQYVLDVTNRLPIEFAAAEGHLQIFKMLFAREKIDINRKGNEDFTMLHIAAQLARSEMVEYLIEKGADINARNNCNSKPIHIAAREGFLDVVKIFLRHGIDINDRGIGGNTLLHYSSSMGKLEVMRFLLDRGLGVDYTNLLGQTSLHIAFQVNNKNSIEFLLNAGATYNILDRHQNVPATYSWNREINKVHASLNALFEFIKLNKSDEIEKLIKLGVILNARHIDMISPLHLAVYKNRESIVKLLLKNKASVNLISKNGWTLLHYAAKYSDIKIVKLLLIHGAKYDAVSDAGKTPFQFSRNDSVKSLLTLISELFEGVLKGDTKAMNRIRNIKDSETIKAVMNAQNKSGHTIMKYAMENNFPKTEELKWVAQQDLLAQAGSIELYTLQEKYPQALQILEKIHKRRRDVFGKNNPATLEIQVNIADILCKQQDYQRAASVCKKVYQKQVQLLSVNNEQTLKTNSMLGLALHRLGRNEEALSIFKETHEKQTRILGEDHEDLFRTKCHMALVLNSLSKFKEALEMHRVTLEISKRKFGIFDLSTFNVQNNMAMVLTNMGQYDEASQIYDEVYNARKEILGVHHSDTMRCLRNKIGILKVQEKYDEALKMYEQIYKDQKLHLGVNHIDTIDTCHNIADILLCQGKHFNAFKMFKEINDRKKTLLGEKHPEVEKSSQRIKLINETMKLLGMPMDINNYVGNLQLRLIKASSEGDLETVQNFLKNDVEVNERDAEGRSALHFAVDGCHARIINLLLINGANVAEKTNRGNTTLHTACSKNAKEIVEILLNHVGKEKLVHFINSQTNVGKQTALHVAAKNDNLAIVELLLEKGAIHNIQNKSGETPSKVTQNRNILDLLKLIEVLFKLADVGKLNSMFDMLETLKEREFICALNARNLKGCTILKILIQRGAIEMSRTLAAKLKLFNV